MNLGGGGGGGGTDRCVDDVSLSISHHEHAPNWVAEHLGASSRRPRHPFPALMAGVTPGRVPVYTALKTHPINPRTTPVDLYRLQLELEVVVVVGTNIVNAAEPSLSMQTHPKSS